jgi:hypothetical protein
MDIPSIEYLTMSKDELYPNKNDGYSDSNVSAMDCLSDCILDSEPELMLSYVYLVEKALT